MVKFVGFNLAHKNGHFDTNFGRSPKYQLRSLYMDICNWTDIPKNLFLLEQSEDTELGVNFFLKMDSQHCNMRII